MKWLVIGLKIVEQRIKESIDLVNSPGWQAIPLTADMEEPDVHESFPWHHLGRVNV